MRMRTIVIGALFLLCLTTVNLAQTQSASDRLALGDQMERTVGPEAAIPIYQSVLRDFPNDRTNDAKALLQMIKAYDTLGQSDKGWEHCQRVINQYADQPVIGDARTRCALLAPPPPRTKVGIFIAEVDPASGTIRQPVRPFTEDPNAEEGGATWSPDGRSLSFRRAVINTFGGTTQGAPFVRSLESKVERSLATCGGGIGFGGHNTWFPDGKTLLTTGGGVGTTGCLQRNDVQTGRIVEQRPFPNLPSTNSTTLSADGMTLYAVLPTNLGSSSVTTVTALDLLTLRAKSAFILPLDEGWSIGRGQIITISPDGRTLALLRRPNTPDARLVLFDVDGNNYRELVIGSGQLLGVAWSKDGNRILFARSDDGNNWQIMQVPAAGGAPSFSGLEVTGLQFFDFNRENTQIAFTGLASKVSPPGPAGR